MKLRLFVSQLADAVSYTAKALPGTGPAARPDPSPPTGDSP